MASTNVRWTVAKYILDRIRVRGVDDAATTNNDATLTSATAEFVVADIGRPISGAGIPADTTIASRNSATSVELSANATATATGVDIVIGDPDLSEVSVTPGYAGDMAAPDSVWLDSIEGEISIPVMTAGRKHRDDKFEIPIEIKVHGNGRDHDAVMDRATEIAAAFEDDLANDPGLQALDGVISAEVTEERASCGELKDGWTAFAEVVVSVHARLT